MVLDPVFILIVFYLALYTYFRSLLMESWLLFPGRGQPPESLVISCTSLSTISGIFNHVKTYYDIKMICLICNQHIASKLMPVLLIFAPISSLPDDWFKMAWTLTCWLEDIGIVHPDKGFAYVVHGWVVIFSFWLTWALFNKN